MVLDSNLNTKPTTPQDDRQFHRGKFVNAMREIYRPLGFKKSYIFPLFIIFGGAMLRFILAGFSYLNVTGDAAGSYKSNASAGDWYHYHTGRYRIGIILHLAGCLPARFLAVFQFVPVIRHKAIIFHRINGYIAILLALIVNAGALMIVRRAFSGGLDVQSRCRSPRHPYHHFLVPGIL